MAAVRTAKLSSGLAKLLGKPEATRPEVIQAIWNHIRSNNLKDAAKKTLINCDSTLKELFNRDNFNQTELFGLLSPHIEKAPKPAPKPKAPKAELK